LIVELIIDIAQRLQNLTPVPEKNHFRRNEPAFVKSVLLKLAEVRRQDPDQLAQIIWDNTCRLYNLRP
jgi:TatD DNase family protein